MTVRDALLQAALAFVWTSGDLFVLAQQKPERTYWPNCTDEPLSANAICDRSLSPSERAASLVATLYPEEKLENLVRCVLDLKHIIYTAKAIC